MEELASSRDGKPRIVRHSKKWASERIGRDLGNLRVLLATNRTSGEQWINVEDDDGQGFSLSARRATDVGALLIEAARLANERSGVPPPKVTHEGDWGRFLRERHLLIRDWVAEGQSFEQIALTFSMDPMQVQLISMTPIPEGKDRYGF